MNQGVRHFPACLLDNPGESGSGDSHLLGRAFLIEPVQVGQSQGFDFIESQSHLFKGMKGNTLGFEEIGMGFESDATQATRPWHGNAPFSGQPL